MISDKEKIRNRIKCYVNNNIQIFLTNYIRKTIIDSLVILIDKDVTNFILSFPNSTWLENQYFNIRALITTTENDPDIVNNIKNNIKIDLKICNNNQDSFIKNTYGDIIVETFRNSLSQVLYIYSSVTTTDIIHSYLITQNKLLAEKIEKNEINEFNDFVKIKQTSIIRSLLQSEEGLLNHVNSFYKQRYYEHLQANFIALNNNKWNFWSHLHTNFKKDEDLFPYILRSTNTETLFYDFKDFNSIDFVVYCRDVIEGNVDTSLIEFMKNRNFGEYLPDNQKELLIKYREEEPDRFNETYEQVHLEYLHKFVRYTALTSLVTLIDAFINEICNTLNLRGYNIEKHKFNISVTYQRLKKSYTNNAIDHYPNFPLLVDSLDQLFEKDKGSFRNSIAHLDGVDLNAPYYYFDDIYNFLKQTYFHLADFMKFEQIPILLTIDRNELDAEDYKNIRIFKNAFQDYTINKLILGNPLKFIQEFLLKSENNSIHFFMDESRSIKFVDENWDSIYPEFNAIKNDIINVFDHVKTDIAKLSIGAIVTPSIIFSDNEMKEQLRRINISSIYEKLKRASEEIVEKIALQINTIIPSFEALSKSATYSVNTKNKNEAFLSIVMNSILIEKLLIHIKLCLKLTNNINCSYTGNQENRIFYINYKNLEIRSPSHNSYTPDSALRQIYNFATSLSDTENESDYMTFKSILITVEKLRNICAHGKVSTLESDFDSINKFLFFVTYRLQKN